MQGVCPYPSVASLDRFTAWAERVPDRASVALNQASVSAFEDSIPWAVDLGRQFIARGTQVIWSVPCPGAGELESLPRGAHDARLRHIAAGVVAVTPGSGPIWVRLPWEFNLAEQENVARDKRGKWDAALFRSA